MAASHQLAKAPWEEKGTEPGHRIRAPTRLADPDWPLHRPNVAFWDVGTITKVRAPTNDACREPGPKLLGPSVTAPIAMAPSD
jgi:hypothetical protein